MADIVCNDCGEKLGEALVGYDPTQPQPHSCVDCWMESMGVDQQEWMHLENQPSDIQHMSPITTLYVLKRGVFDDVVDSDDDLHVTLCHEDLRAAPVPMMMGNLRRKLHNGRTHIDGLYVRGTGNFCLRIDTPGCDPLYTHSFKVT
jgi:hypothetical protein